jgi:hypothetical protein
MTTVWIPDASEVSTAIRAVLPSRTAVTFAMSGGDQSLDVVW